MDARRLRIHYIESVAMDLVRIPGGTITVGAAEIREAEAPNPPHRVVLSAFRLGRFPVTNAEYRAFVDATSHRVPGSWSDPRFADPSQPVVCVSWHDARACCRWMGGDLPTEAQWERAAGEGRYPWGDTEPDDTRACFARDWNRDGPAPVGEHPAGASPWGVHDLAGNVWEWCLDAFIPDAHRVRRGNDPVAADTAIRPLRGGCWRSIDCKIQRAYRNWFHEKAPHVTMGFRVCLLG